MLNTTYITTKKVVEIAVSINKSYEVVADLFQKDVGKAVVAKRCYKCSW